MRQPMILNWRFAWRIVPRGSTRSWRAWLWRRWRKAACWIGTLSWSHLHQIARTRMRWLGDEVTRSWFKACVHSSLLKRMRNEEKMGCLYRPRACAKSIEHTTSSFPHKFKGCSYMSSQLWFFCGPRCDILFLPQFNQCKNSNQLKSHSIQCLKRIAS